MPRVTSTVNMLDDVWNTAGELATSHGVSRSALIEAAVLAFAERQPQQRTKALTAAYEASMDSRSAE